MSTIKLSHTFLVLISVTIIIGCSFFKEKKPKEQLPLKVLEFPDYTRLFKDGLRIEKIDSIIFSYNSKNRNSIDTLESSELSNYRRWRTFWYPRQSKENSLKFGPQEYLSALIDFSDSEICGDSDQNAGDWVSLGPFRGPSYAQTDLQTLGAIFSVAADPDHLNTVYVGTGSGGLWKTTNALSSVPTWINLTDQLRLPSLGISDIAIDPFENEIVYAITSSGPRHGYGLGVIKSNNGGRDWRPTDLTFDPFELTELYKLLIHPVNSSIVYVLADNEVFKTSDGGITWPTIPMQGELDSLRVSGRLDFKSMEFNLSNPDILYVGGERILKYNSINNDWQDLKLINEAPTLPAGLDGHYSFEARLSGTNDGFYALIKWTYPGLDDIGEIRKYNESSNSWEFIKSVIHFAEIFIVNPHNPNIIYLGYQSRLNSSRRTSNCCTSLYSIDGATAFFKMTHYWPRELYNGVSTHADVRAMKLLSASQDGLNDVLLQGNDGGVLLAENANRNIVGFPNRQLINWRNINGTGLSITEFFGVASSEINPYRMYLGAQDNGLFAYNYGQWKVKLRGIGDAYGCAVDPHNPLLAYGQGNYPGLHQTSNSGDSWDRINDQPSWNQICQDLRNNCFPSWTGVYKWPLFFGPNEVLYLGHYDLYKFENEDWVQISDFAPEMSNFGEEGFHPGLNLIAAEVSKFDQNIILAAFPTYRSSDNVDRLFRTVNGGDDWIDITPRDARWHGITDVVSASNDTNKIWVTLDRLDDDIKRVNYSNDGGATWYDLSNGLPFFPVNCIAYQEGSNDILYVGTDVGVFYREGEITDPNNPSPWRCFSKNLPSTLIRDLEINYCSQKIRAATFGRGLWESPLINDNTILAPDSDDDGICDAGDQCPDVDDSIIGTPCDDGDLCTANDVYDRNCNCMGTPVNSFDLMIKDNSLTDTGIEPNTGDIWNGNIWNCPNENDLGCSSLDSGNPEYKINGFNRIRVQIENRGCTAYTRGEAKLHLYWTIGRSEEIWPGHWLDPIIEPTNIIDGFPAGGEITPSEGGTIPSLPAGGLVEISYPWAPPNPANFPSISGAPMICFLARIESLSDPIIGEANGPISENVKNSNNIATINTTLVDIDPSNEVFPNFSFYLNNSSNQTASINLLIEDLDKGQPSFFEQGTLVVELNKIDEKGKNDPPVSIKITDQKGINQLKNILLKPGERIPVNIRFVHPKIQNILQSEKVKNFKLRVKTENQIIRNRSTEFILNINVSNAR